MHIDYMNTPIGIIEIQASDTGIREINYREEKSKTIHSHPLIDNCKQQLQEYFDGERATFDIPLEQQGTDFQMGVWKALTHIPFGQTSSYGDVAKAINNPKSVRAVGGANNRNTVSIIVPCHRVIGSDGSLYGYNGGIDKKLWLLKHEGATFTTEEKEDAQQNLF